MSEESPKLRNDIEILPATVEGQTVLVVRDPVGLIEKPIALSEDLFGLVSMLDGTHTIEDMQAILTRQRGGVLVMREEVQRIITQLDQLLVLDNERYRTALTRLADEFARHTVRNASHAGQTYPVEPERLRARLDVILKWKHVANTPASQDIIALVAPHIDLNVGDRAYAAAYHTIQDARPERILIFGTGHRMDKGILCVTDKDFETPLGSVKTDKETVERIRELGGESLAPNDLPHKSEHSIEFQVLFLQHLFPKHEFTIVPILFGSFDEIFDELERPSDIPGVSQTLGYFREMIEQEGGKTLVIAGVDLSHVGPKFGDKQHAGEIVQYSQKHDEKILGALVKKNMKALWKEMKRVQDAYHVCGFSTLACLLEILPPCRGTLLHYDVWHEQATSSAVSFASLAFSRMGK